MRRRFLHAVLALTLAFGAWSARAQPAAGDDPIVLALIEGLSGSFANAGEAVHHPNLGTPASERFYAEFRSRFPKPEDDYVHARLQVMVEMLVAAIERAGTSDAAAVARALEGMRFDPRVLGGVHTGTMRATDHQFIQPLVVSVMDKLGAPGVPHDNEGSGFGFRTLRAFEAKQTEQPTTCKMEHP